MIIVQKDDYEELKQFKKRFSYIEDMKPLTHADIVKIDTYKDTFEKYLTHARQSIIIQRWTDVGHEEELLGAINVLTHLITDIHTIDKKRNAFEQSKESSWNSEE